MKRRKQVAVSLLITLAPAAAWACPVCAGRETNTGMMATFLGLMIAVPYAIAVVAIRTIRKADKENAWSHEAAAAPDASR